MKINVLTIFPNFIETLKKESIIKRAIERKLVEINIIDFREFSENKHNKVDDIIYGGGHGMLLMVGPIDRALKTVGGRKILLSPQGKRYNQAIASELKDLDEITLIAGHYEGFDERVRTLIDDEISLGDYVLTGGEIPAMAIIDSIVRLIPGVIKEESFINDSFQNNMLDYPQYTRPAEYNGLKVPEVLMNGNHKEIEKWRQENKYKNTKDKRPDLLERKENEK